jgi:hypothetical protein
MIMQPTTLTMTTTGELKVDQGRGEVNVTKVSSLLSNVAFSSYSTGVKQLSIEDGDVNLGKATACVFFCDKPVTFMTDEMSVALTTSIFAYDNKDLKTTISISCDYPASMPATIEYIIGEAL